MFWNQPARLMRTNAAGAAWKGSRAPIRIGADSLARIMLQIEAEGREEIWRFLVITEDGRHFRSPELRALMRRPDYPGTRA